MNVLLITNDPTILDTGSSGFMQARENAAAIGNLHVIMEGEVPEERHEEQLHIYVVRTSGLFQKSPMQTTAQTLLVAQQIQAIWTQDPFELGMLGVTLSRTSGLPLYVSVYTDFLSPWYATRAGMFRSSTVKVPKQNQLRTKLADTVLPHATGIRVMSERVKTSLVSRFGDRIVVPEVIPVQVDLTLPAPVALPAHMFPFVLMAAGRLDAGRRVIDIVDALARIKDRYPGVGLFVVGDGPERTNLERHVRALTLSDRVLFLGDRSDTFGLMQSAHVFVQASAHEGYGRRLLQAALARVPIITTDVGIVGEVFKGYDDVLAMPPGDPSAIATHIMGLMEDGQARQLLAMNAEVAAKKFLAAAGNIPARLAAFLTPKAVSTPSV